MVPPCTCEPGMITQLSNPAYDTARATVLELIGAAPAHPIDTLALGLVLETDERAVRQATAWLDVRWLGQWQSAQWVTVTITDRRLLARLPSGELASLWWGSVVGAHVDLASAQVILDAGDGVPRRLSGPEVPTIAVAALWFLFGRDGLLRHPSLAPLRAAL